MQPVLTLVSGCQQTVALTFLTNELFQFNDPFCRKNKKIAEIITIGRQGRSVKGQHPHIPHTLSPNLTYTLPVKTPVFSNNASSLCLCPQGACYTSSLSIINGLTSRKKEKYSGYYEQVAVMEYTLLCVCKSDTFFFFWIFFPSSSKA